MDVCACRALKEMERIMDLTAVNAFLCEQRKESTMLRIPFARANAHPMQHRTAGANMEAGVRDTSAVVHCKSIL